MVLKINKETFPIWAPIAVVAGLLTTIGAFLKMWSIDMGAVTVDVYLMDFINGITVEEATFPLEFTFYRYFPLIIAMLGILLTATGLLATVERRVFVDRKLSLMIFGTISLAMFLLTLVFIIQQGSLVTGVWAEAMKNFTTSLGPGIYLFFVGSILGFVSAALAYAKPTLAE